jgi:hypothetical protein
MKKLNILVFSELLNLKMLKSFLALKNQEKTWQKISQMHIAERNRNVKP